MLGIELLFILLTFFLAAYLLRIYIRAKAKLTVIKVPSAYVVAFALLLWLSILSVLASIGFFRNFTALPPRLIVALGPPVLFTLYLLFSKKSGQLLVITPVTSLVYIQSFRIIVELLLWLLFRRHTVPYQMTFEGRNWDILTGLSAPVMAYLYRRGSITRIGLIVWNIAGLVLLFNIVTIAVLSTPSPIRVFMNDPANTIIAEFPFIWLPGFMVPVAFLLHCMSLKQLMQVKTASTKLAS
jgi:hypothetical protein